MYPFVVGMSCLAGYFGGLGYWENPSLMEELLRAQNKGAVAALMPTGETDTDGQHILNTALFEALFSDDIRRLGPAIAAAKQTLLANGGDQYEQTSATFLLFGDPAMELKIPLPRRPDGLQGLWRLDGEVELNWQSASDSNGQPAVGYNIYRSTRPGQGYIKLNADTLSATAYVDTGIGSQRTAALTTGATYYYAVAAVDADGDESPRSPVLSPTLEPAPLNNDISAGNPENTSNPDMGAGGGTMCFVATAQASFFGTESRISSVLGLLALIGLLWLGNKKAKGRRRKEKGQRGKERGATWRPIRSLRLRSSAFGRSRSVRPSADSLPAIDLNKRLPAQLRPAGDYAPEGGAAARREGGAPQAD
jgi:hypothetical protein